MLGILDKAQRRALQAQAGKSSPPRRLLGSKACLGKPSGAIGPRGSGDIADEQFVAILIRELRLEGEAQRIAAGLPQGEGGERVFPRAGGRGGDRLWLDGAERGEPPGERILDSQPLGIVLALELRRGPLADDLRVPILIAPQQRCHQRIGLRHQPCAEVRASTALSRVDQFAVLAHTALESRSSVASACTLTRRPGLRGEQRHGSECEGEKLEFGRHAPD